jgi:SH3-like domain-containing protein
MIKIGRATALAALFASAAVLAASERTVPYWASIAAGDALMRAGPGREFPAVWRYRRADLPIQVVQIHQSWRKIREIDGTEGWMAAALLSAQRTALVTGEVRPLRSAPDQAARIVWRVEPGVVGRVSHCAAGWCEFAVGGRGGYIQTDHIWGVAPDETID